MKKEYCFEYVYDKKGNKVGFMWGGVGFTSKLTVMTSFCNTKAGDVFVECGSKYKIFDGNFNKIPYAHKKQFNHFLMKIEKEIDKNVVRPDWFKEAIKELTKPKITFISTPLSTKTIYNLWFDHADGKVKDFKVTKNRFRQEPKKYPPLTIIEHGTKNILYEGEDMSLAYSVIMIKGLPYRFINHETVKDIDLKYDFKVVSVEKMKGLISV